MIQNHIQLVCWHSGLPFSDFSGFVEPTCLPLCEVFRRLGKNEKIDYKDSFISFVNGLNELNFALNGKIPSESQQCEKYFTRDIVAAIASLNSRAIESYINTNSIETAKLAWRISFLWEAVTAGDIDDILGNLYSDESVRFNDQLT